MTSPLQRIEVVASDAGVAVEEEVLPCGRRRKAVAVFRQLGDLCEKRQHWFLPPVFGSEARGSYPIFLAHRNIEDAQLVSELAKVGRDAPCILLVFDRMTKARRESFALAMRRAKQTVLLLDEAQVLYLTANTSWMERLFTCAAPFGYLQPYTTSAGNIPGEMFFGRMAEIAKIESATTDGCLVYGGLRWVFRPSSFRHRTFIAPVSLICSSEIWPSLRVLDALALSSDEISAQRRERAAEQKVIKDISAHLDMQTRTITALSRRLATLVP